jgi:hypothetical protein
MPTMNNAHALIVGIANYTRIAPLPETVLKDARDVHELLLNPQYGGYAGDNTKLLLDKDATKENINRALAELAGRADPESVVIIYLSGHGGRVESGTHAGQYILPVNASYDSAEALARTAISGAEFTRAVEKIAARKVVVLFDCCYAAGIKDAAAPSSLKLGLSERYYEELQAGRGRVVIASSRGTEYSHVLPEAKNSLFTQHLLAGLQGGIPSDDGFIRIFDLFEYVQPRVTGDVPTQHPVFRGELEENFPVALYVGGVKGVVPQVEEGFRYDVYISYVDKEPDATFIWETLVPRLEAAGLKVAVSGDVEEGGVARVVSIERAIKQSKRTLIALSDNFLADRMSKFQETLAMSMGVQEGTYRLLPAKIGEFDAEQLPARISGLTTRNLVHPRRAEGQFDLLIRDLKDPLPTM